MILTKISVDCDLSEAAVSEAKRYCPDMEHLYVSSSDIRTAQKLSRVFGLTYYLDDNLPQYAWYIKGKALGMFSPGA